jgi:hypothetical protein
MKRDKRKKIQSRSGYERKVLDNLDKNNIKYYYEEIKLKYIIEKSYVPDILIIRKDGTELFVECKGYWSGDDRLKMRIIKNTYPDMDIRILFQRASEKINKKSKVTYGEYATKIGFIWAEGIKIPEEWLN